MINKQRISYKPEVGSIEDRAGSREADELLALALRDGSRDALEELYDRHVRQCFGLAVKIVQEQALAEDVVQEVFIKLWSRPETFCPERGTFHTWLLTVVRNKSLDKLRSLKGLATLTMLPLLAENGGPDTLVTMLPDTAPSPHDQVWTNEIAGIVWNALRQLPTCEYQVINLAYMGGLTQREIADKLQQPLGTVKTRTRSALRHLHYLVVAQGVLSD